MVWQTPRASWEDKFTQESFNINYTVLCPIHFWLNSLNFSLWSSSCFLHTLCVCSQSRLSNCEINELVRLSNTLQPINNTGCTAPANQQHRMQARNGGAYMIGCWSQIPTTFWIEVCAFKWQCMAGSCGFILTAGESFSSVSVLGHGSRVAAADLWLSISDLA